MNYENFYSSFSILEKMMKDKVQNAQKSFKGIIKKSEYGDLKGLVKDLTQAKLQLNEYSSVINDMYELANGFDAEQYMESGEFAEQMIEYCKGLDVDVNGTYPVFDMFPFKVKIDSENQDVYIDKRKLHCVRPQSFVNEIKRGKDKLTKAAFNVSTFLNELAEAYDLAVTIKSQSLNNIKSEFNLSLHDLHKYLAPMQRFRREYDIQSYSFDLARLYQANADGGLVTKDGRCIEFGTSKATKKLIRILDRHDNEQFLGTIRFFVPDAGDITAPSNED